MPISRLQYRLLLRLRGHPCRLSLAADQRKTIRLMPGRLCCRRNIKSRLLLRLTGSPFSELHGAFLRLQVGFACLTVPDLVHFSVENFWLSRGRFDRIQRTAPDTARPDRIMYRVTMSEDDASDRPARRTRRYRQRHLFCGSDDSG